MGAAYPCKSSGFRLGGSVTKGAPGSSPGTPFDDRQTAAPQLAGTATPALLTPIEQPAALHARTRYW